MAKSSVFQSTGTNPVAATTAAAELDAFKIAAEAAQEAAETSETNAASSATAAASSASSAAASAAQAASDAATGASIGTKNTPTAAPSNGDLLKFSTASDAWVYSTEIDAGTY